MTLAAVAAFAVFPFALALTTPKTIPARVPAVIPFVTPTGIPVMVPISVAMAIHFVEVARRCAHPQSQEKEQRENDLLQPVDLGTPYAHDGNLQTSSDTEHQRKGRAMTRRHAKGLVLKGLQMIGGKKPMLQHGAARVLQHRYEGFELETPFFGGSIPYRASLRHKVARCMLRRTAALLRFQPVCSNA